MQSMQSASDVVWRKVVGAESCVGLLECVAAGQTLEVRMLAAELHIASMKCQESKNIFSEHVAFCL